MYQPTAFRGRVDKGLLHLDDPARWRGFLAKLEGCRVTVEVDKEEPRRTTAQNRRYFLIVRDVRAFWNTSRTVQLSKLQVHDVLKRVFIGMEPGPLGVDIACSSRTLSIEEFTDYMDRICAHFANESGLPLPTGPDPARVAL